MKTHVRALGSKLAAAFGRIRAAAARRIKATTLAGRTIGTVGRMRAASLAVNAAVAVELLAVGLASRLAWGRLSPLVDGIVDLDRLPPWPLLAAGPFVGVAAALLRAWRPDQSLRRWHGVALRRVDERFG